MTRRVVVTGIGPVAPCGVGKDEYWENSLEGISGSHAVNFDWYDPKKFKAHACATLPELDYSDVPTINPRTDIRLGFVDRNTLVALKAIELARLDAGLGLEQISEGRYKLKNDDREIDQRKVGVRFGTGVGGFRTVEENLSRYYYDKLRLELNENPNFQEIEARIKELMNVPKRFHKLTVPKLICNAVAAESAIRNGAKGPVSDIVLACTSGTEAVGCAYKDIKSGIVDIVISGGVDTFLDDGTGFGFKGFDAVDAMASNREIPPEKSSRPFDKYRSGFVLGEGGCALIVESLEHARRRGARIYAEIVGHNLNCDAYNMMQLDPSPDNLVYLMESVLEQMHISATGIGYFNAHGTSTPSNDPAESKAMQVVFGDYLKSLPVVSTKSRNSHLVAGAGALEAGETCLVLYHQKMAPSINYDIPDQECPVNVITEVTEKDINAALSSSYGFGGHNACLGFRRFEE